MIGAILTVAELLVLVRLGLVHGPVRTRRAQTPLLALLVRVFQGNVPRWCNQMIGLALTVAELLVLARLSLVRGSVRIRRNQPPLLALRSVVLEPDRGRNTASRIVPLVATPPWLSLELVSSAGRCAHVAPRPRCSRFSSASSNAMSRGGATK